MHVPLYRPLRRALLAVTSLLAATALVSGCATTTSDTGNTSDSTSDSTAAFPVTIEHALGTAEIETKPERIVTIGWYSQDVVAALGTVPVGVPDFTWGNVDTYLPWFEDRVNELGSELPEVISNLDGSEISFEAIGALEPDLILAVDSGITDEEYAKLSAIAPTVAYADNAWVADQTELTLTIGKALGAEEEAQQLLDDADASVAAAAAAHPEFAGVVFTYGWYLPEGATTFDFYLESDPRVPLVEQLGFTVSPQIAEAAGDTSILSVSLEQLSTIESEFHIGWVDPAGDETETVENELVALWAPIANDSYYFVSDQRLGWATSMPSVLSIPSTIDDLADELATGLNVTG